MTDAFKERARELVRKIDSDPDQSPEAVINTIATALREASVREVVISKDANIDTSVQHVDKPEFRRHEITEEEMTRGWFEYCEIASDEVLWRVTWEAGVRWALRKMMIKEACRAVREKHRKTFEKLAGK